MYYLSGKLTSILASIALLSLVPSVRAEDIYIAQNAQSSDTGADAANAHSAAWFNTLANWGTGAGNISAGDTVHLVGTISMALTVQASGSSGNVITILFESGAKLSAAHWGALASPALNLNAKSYLVIDGGTNGLIEATDNGTTKTYQVDSTGISFGGGGGSHNITIQNLTVTNMYDRTSFSTTDSNRMGIAIALGTGSYLVVQNCTLSGGDTMIVFPYQTGSVSNWTITGNTISNCNHGIFIETYTVNAYVTNVTVSNNTIDHVDYWGPISGNHLDGIIVSNDASDRSGSITNFYIYGNTIGPHIGTINSAAIYFGTLAASQIVNLQVYNNLFRQVSPYSWSNGFVSIGGSTNSFVFNNTFISYEMSGGGSGIGLSAGNDSVNLTHKNNLYYSVRVPINLGSGSTWPTGLVSEYNIYYEGTDFYGPNYVAGTWSNWTGTAWHGTAYDAAGYSTLSQPTLDTNYVPTSADTVATGKGTNLSAYFTTDKIGDSRPSSGTWDIGAFVSGAVVSGAPSGAVAPSAARTTITVH